MTQRDHIPSPRALGHLLLLVLCVGFVHPALAEDSAPPQQPVKMIILGDSLTAGWGLEVEQAYPALMEAQLQEEGYQLRITNAGVSGDTFAAGLERLPWLLQQEPDWLVVALGANDGLRGLSIKRSTETLREIVRAAHKAEVQVALIGIDLPWNYGSDYREEFKALFPAVAEEFSLPLLPFLLEGVAMKEEYNFPDRLHPNEKGQHKVAEHVLPFIRGLIDPQDDEEHSDAEEAGDEALPSEAGEPHEDNRSE